MGFLRHLFIFIGGIVAVLLIAVVVNTALKGSRQIAATPVAPVAIDKNAAAARLSSAIKLKTISNYAEPDGNADAFLGLHALIEQSYPAFSTAATREIVGKYSLLYTWKGSDASAAPIALLAHQDVVPIAPGTESKWTVPPFDGAIKDGFVWGRGSWDDKGNLFSMLEAAEQLAKDGFKPKRTIYFAFGHDEEVSGQRGAKAVAALLASRGIKLDFVLDEGLLITEGILKGLDPPAALIGVAEKGFVTLNLDVTATPGHSSMPPKDTAIGMMSAALAKLEDKRMPGRIRGISREMFDTLAPEMNFFNRLVLSNLWLTRPLVQRELDKTGSTSAMLRTTTALTIFNAGNQDNVLPGQANASVNFRLLPGDTQDSVVGYVKDAIRNDKIGITPGPGNSNPPPVTATDTDSYKTLARTIREVFPGVVVAPGLMIAATDSRHYTNVTENIFRFSPVRAKSDDLSRFHGTDERISIDNYADMIRFYRRLLQNTAG